MEQPLIAPDLTDEPPALVTGDAAHASAVLEAWLARQAAIPAPDWEGCFAQIRDGLVKLASMPLIQNDPDAGAIMVDMATAEDMEQFAADMDRLSVRVAQLLGNTASKRTQATVLNIAALQSWNNASQADTAQRERIEMPSRMVLRL